MKNLKILALSLVTMLLLTGQASSKVATEEVVKIDVLEFLAGIKQGDSRLAIPKAYLLNEKGEVVYTHEGSLDDEKQLQLLEAMQHPKVSDAGQNVIASVLLNKGVHVDHWGKGMQLVVITPAASMGVCNPCQNRYPALKESVEQLQMDVRWISVSMEKAGSGAATASPAKQ